jgi:glutamate dehydrogenase
MAASVGPLLAEVEDRINRENGGDRERLLSFARALLRRAPRERLGTIESDALFDQIASLYRFVDERRDALDVRVIESPAGGSALEANIADAPFLVDTVRETITGEGYTVRLLLHPVLGIERTPTGSIASVGDARSAHQRESIIHVELDQRLDAAQAAALTAAAREALTDLRLAVGDHPQMLDVLSHMIDAASASTARYSDEEIDETVAFLEWLKDHHFVVLGTREYSIVEHEGAQAVTAVKGSGLGILRDDTQSLFKAPVPLDELPSKLRARVTGGELLVISKTRRASTVHRRVRMDDIAIKKVNQSGEITGELRVLGLFTSSVFMEQAARTPLLRRKLRRILAAEDLIQGSHDYKAVVAIFESFPRDELFQARADELRRQVMAVLAAEESKQVTLTVRLDPTGRNVTVLVAMPRDRFSAEVRERLQALVLERYDGVSSDYHLSLGDMELAELFFTIHVGERGIPDVSYEELEADIVAACRSWDDELADQLAAIYGEPKGRALGSRYARRLPDYYKSATDPRMALRDIEGLERVRAGEAFAITLQNERRDLVAEGATPLTRLVLSKQGGKAPLSSFLHVLEDLGLTVVEEVPTRLLGEEEDGAYLHDFGILVDGGNQADLDSMGVLMADAASAAWRGDAESDSLNRLVVRGHLAWDQVAILRAYRKYRNKVAPVYTQSYQNDVLAANAETARLLMELFRERFSTHTSSEHEEELRREIDERIQAVKSLDEDRILRAFLGMIDATVRTNAYLGKPYLSFKLRSDLVPGMPKPFPLYEIYVYSPQMEGIHLRGGPIARGGIRWSDRREDYRTEVLGLMKAQMVKNAVIVPVGSKGGFVLRTAPTDRAELQAEVRRQYTTLMRGMLDITDNIAGGRVVHPEGIRIYDGEDPYLVVAADKGTAALSDLANSIAIDYGFWLGDAFASGGSQGYDHKALGITARGAWESVKRHFRQLGHDVATQPFTAIGIGDMSGDVFGNGILLSDQIRLVAAFDHRHVFLDPNPDPAASFAERRRLFDLGAGTSWADYDASVLSEGGGVFPRSAKSVTLSPQVRQALGIDAEQLTPNELVRCILRAPVDLFWNGGIGTFVKASDEANADVGDRTNDAIRIDGRELRARVVGEGGNLGFTQKGRIEYALAGGRINTDAIDNSAGVDTSDHEVNIKVLLGQALERGVVKPEERDSLLASQADEVCRQVLYDNYLQVQILSQEEAEAPVRFEAHEDLMRELEAEGLLERSIEFLPSSELMAERKRAGRPLTRPELAVLLAYAKRSLRAKVLASRVPDDPWLDADLRDYFPKALVEVTGDLYREHQLRREIIATVVTNDVINSLGITWVWRLVAETGAEPADVVRAFLIAREVSHARRRWDEIEALFANPKIDTALQMQLMDSADWLVDSLSRWYLQNASVNDLTAVIERDEPAFAQLAADLRRLGSSEWRAERALRREALVAQGIPSSVAEAAAWHPELAYAPDIIAAARATDRPLPEAANTFFLLGERLHLDWLETQVDMLSADSKWQRWALGAISDDLHTVRAELTQKVLEEGASADVDESIERFCSAREESLARLERLIGTLRNEGLNDLAAATVAVRQLRAALA